MAVQKTLQKKELAKICGLLAKKVREKVPLIQNITNYVTVNDVANAQLAIGASPVMADAKEEIEDMLNIAAALNINIGTLNERTIDSFMLAGKVANETKTPLVFDPVGAGASTLRNNCAKGFLAQVKPTVIRGNLSEIAFIAGIDAQSKGVDAGIVNADASAEDIAAQVARKYDCTCAITGKIDVISNGKRTLLVKNGTEKMSKITGTGCMCDGLIAAFIACVDSVCEENAADGADSAAGADVAVNGADSAAVDVDAVGAANGVADTACGNSNFYDEVLLATTAAIASMGIAGQLAKRDLETLGAMVGTGSLRVGIIDRLSLLSTDDYRIWANIEEA